MSREVQREIAIAFGATALITIIISVIALAFVHTTETTTITPTVPSPAVSPSPLPPLQLSTLIPSNVVINSAQVEQYISPVASQAVSPQVDNSPPDTPPNMVPPSQTLSRPLQVTPQTIGFSAMTFAGDQLLSSMENGEVCFAQFQFVVSTGHFSMKPVLNYSYINGSNGNRFVQSVGTTGSQTQSVELNKAASANGSVGPMSIVLSTDNLRLYVSYRDSTFGKDSPFPLSQTVGRVQVWSRAPGASDTSITDQWERPSHFTLSNPFGSQTQGVGQGVQNSFTTQISTGDDFGSYIRASNNSKNGKYSVAIASNFGQRRALGRCINIFEENSDRSHDVVAVLFLPNEGPFAQRFDADARQSFATSFAFQNGTCISGFGAHSKPETRALAHFQRVGSSRWTFVGIIEPPTLDNPSFFGTSLVLSPDTTMLIVGAPNANNVPGGNVVLFDRTDNEWNPTQIVSDPWLAPQPFPNTRAFGWFVHVDRDFRILAVSGNQDTTYDKNPEISPDGNCVFVAGQQQSPCDYTVVEIFSIDQINRQIVTDIQYVPRVHQQQIKNQFIDPLFGSTVSFSTLTTQGRRVLIGSPVNQVAALYSLS